MEADIAHEQEETSIEQQKAKLALAEAEEESLDKVQSYRDGRWKVYEAEVAQLQSGLVDAKGNIDIKIAASREQVRQKRNIDNPYRDPSPRARSCDSLTVAAVMYSPRDSTPACLLPPHWRGDVECGCVAVVVMCAQVLNEALRVSRAAQRVCLTPPVLRFPAHGCHLPLRATL